MRAFPAADFPKSLGASPMTSQVKAETIRKAFLDALKAQGASVRTMADLAAEMPDPKLRSICQGLGQAGREVYFVGGLGFMNIHVRSEPPGWWSILKSVKKDLAFLSGERRKSGFNCYYILLVGRGDQHIADGYIATDFAKPPFTRLPGVEETKYTINEKQHLDQRALVLSVSRVAKALLDKREKT